jgi:3-deoxy-7-phosphoheptulonate synthase
MNPTIHDRHIRAASPLISPAVLEEEVPLASGMAERIAAHRETIANAIHGRDPRMLAIVGPCSIHDEQAALEYAGRLAVLARELEDDLIIIMRVYFEKPRTTVGWKGLINDPGMDGGFQINEGLRIARRILVGVNSLGLPAANEFLDTIIGQYYADLISWGCIGARTVESQVHRQLASGLSMPVGFKNRTDGDTGVAIEAMLAAAHPHVFPSLTRGGAPAVLATSGNRDTHVVLRGGSRGSNYSTEHLAGAREKLAKAGLPSRVLVDCSHANSGKDPARQPLIAAELAGRVAAGESGLLGIMMESHLIAGRQDPGPDGKPAVYGQSITDACLGWRETAEALRAFARGARE